MEEKFNLKSLKEVWQKQTYTRQYSEDEIFEMTKRKSISSVKYIFYISLAEVLITIFLYIYTFGKTGIKQYHQEMLGTMGDLVYMNEFIYILVGIFNLIFLFLFFRSYTQVSATSNIKKLTESIINLKGYVTKFIYFNVSMSFIVLGLLVYFVFEESGFDIFSKEGVTLIIASILTILVILGLVWLYYYILYGTFLRRLKNNLKELSNIGN